MKIVLACFLFCKFDKFYITAFMYKQWHLKEGGDKYNSSERYSQNNDVNNLHFSPAYFKLLFFINHFTGRKSLRL